MQSLPLQKLHNSHLDFQSYQILLTDPGKIKSRWGWSQASWMQTISGLISASSINLLNSWLVAIKLAFTAREGKPLLYQLSFRDPRSLLALSIAWISSAFSSLMPKNYSAACTTIMILSLFFSCCTATLTTLHMKATNLFLLTSMVCSWTIHFWLHIFSGGAEFGAHYHSEYIFHWCFELTHLSLFACFHLH